MSFLRRIKMHALLNPDNFYDLGLSEENRETIFQEASQRSVEILAHQEVISVRLSIGVVFFLISLLVIQLYQDQQFHTKTLKKWRYYLAFFYFRRALSPYASKLVEEKDRRAFFYAFARALKKYAIDRYSIPVEVETTHEFMHMYNKTERKEKKMQFFFEIYFQSADSIKYGESIPSKEVCQKIFQKIKNVHS
jgi:hypothetical protein